MICHCPLQLQSPTGVTYYYQSRYTTAACAERWDHLDHYVLKAALLFALPLCNCAAMALPRLWALEIKAGRTKAIFTKGTKWHTFPLKREIKSMFFHLCSFTGECKLQAFFSGDPSLLAYHFLLKLAIITF